jgi:hypothetical protein
MPANRWFAVGACTGAQERACPGGRRRPEEISRLAPKASGALVAGFYTYGGIARIRGASGFHNQTLVVLSVG